MARLRFTSLKKRACGADRGDTPERARLEARRAFGSTDAR
jgi:hypothetical protein